MGLDMYLHGEVYLNQYDEKDKLEHNGLPVETVKYRIGYWRKHPNLHGYIVQTFAKGVDECQKIPLDAVDLEQIKKAVETNILPNTEGFFFGKSCDRKSEDSEEAEWAEQQYQDTIKALDRAIKLLSNDGDRQGSYPEIYYEASW